MDCKLSRIARNDLWEITDYYLGIIRIWQLDRFPFLIFYREDSGFLSIIRILDERRDLSADLITH